MKAPLALLAALLLAAPLAAQTPAQWDSLVTTIDSAPNNPPVRVMKDRAFELIARLRLLPGRVDTVTVVRVDTVRVIEFRTDTVYLPCDCDPTDPPPLEPDTSVVEIAITPASGPTVLVGDTVRFTVEALDSAGIAREPFGVLWSSATPGLASVDAEGLATGLEEGFAVIVAQLGSLRDSVLLDVRVPDPPPIAEWDRILSDTLVVGDVVVPEGERWLIGSNVSVRGNVRTDAGTVAMRPGSSLAIVGALPTQYVGGGMRYEPLFAQDWGIWIGGTGVLDVQGTPKTGWNRTGTDPTWFPGDELWIAPTDPGDLTPRRWTPGQPIPQADPRVPPAEVMNVTRDIEISGGHIHISSSQPSRIEYVTLREMGVFKPNVGKGGATSGRYALHMHMQGDGSRGSVVQGVAAIDSKGRVYVPHLSHGVTFRDNVSVNSMAEAFWWDDGDQTNDIWVDRLAVSGVSVDRSYTGQTNRFNAVAMPFGLNMRMTNSAASGVDQGRIGTGFNWDGGARRSDTHWVFDEGNVAHNNSGPGVRFWNNSGQPHHIFDFISYRNGYGIENGAYNNSNRYTGGLLIGNALMQNASSNRHQTDGGPARYERLQVESATGPALEIGGRNLPSYTYAEFIDSEFHTVDGSALVWVPAKANPWFAHFIRTNVTPDDIQWDLSDGRNDGSHVIIEHADGRRWEIRVENSRITVTGG